MRKWFDPNFRLYKIQVKIYNEIFEIKKNTLYKEWRNNSKDLNKDAKFIFLLPQNVLNYKDAFSETRKILTKRKSMAFYIYLQKNL